MAEMQNGDLSGRAIKSVFKYCGTAVRAAVLFKPCLINLLYCRRWNTEFYLQLIGLDVSTSVGVILPPGLRRIVTLLSMSATNIGQTHTLGADCKIFLSVTAVTVSDEAIAAALGLGRRDRQHYKYDPDQSPFKAPCQFVCHRGGGTGEMNDIQLVKCTNTKHVVVGDVTLGRKIKEKFETC